MRTKKDSNGNDVYANYYTEKEIALMSSLVTHHIKTLEGLLDNGGVALPDHKKWMYELEDKLEL
jgi:hypothetical protein